MYYDAFFDLDTTRSHTTSFSRISWLSIREYAEVHDYEPHQVAFLLYCIPQMDNALREVLDKKRNVNGDAGDTGERDTGEGE